MDAAWSESMLPRPSPRTPALGGHRSAVRSRQNGLSTAFLTLLVRQLDFDLHDLNLRFISLSSSSRTAGGWRQAPGAVSSSSFAVAAE